MKEKLIKSNKIFKRKKMKSIFIELLFCKKNNRGVMYITERIMSYIK